MRRKIKVGAICETVELFAAEGPVELEVYRALAVVRALPVRDLKLMHRASRDTDSIVKGVDILPPHLERLLPFVRPYKVFDLHLLEFPDTKDEAPWTNLIADRLPYLPDAKRKVGMERVHDILEIHKDTARSLRP